MSDNLDGDPTKGTPTSPNAGGSQTLGGSDGSNAKQPQLSVEDRLANAEKQLRALQGDKDRAVTQNKKAIDELRGKVAEIEKLRKRGYSEDEAFEQLELQETIRELKSQLQPNSAQTNPAGNGNGAVIDKAKTLQEFGLSENDPDVTSKLLGKEYSNPIEFENAVLRLAFQRQNKPSPDASESTSVSATSPGKTNEDAIYAEIAELSKNYTFNKDKIIALQKKLG